MRRQSIASVVVAVSVLVVNGSPTAVAHGGGHGGRAGHASSSNGYRGAISVKNWSGSGPAWFDPAAKVGFPEDMPLNRLHRFLVHGLPHLHPNGEPQKTGAPR
jgi:hypothetical protein